MNQVLQIVIMVLVVRIISTFLGICQRSAVIYLASIVKSDDNHTESPHFQAN